MSAIRSRHSGDSDEDDDGHLKEKSTGNSKYMSKMMREMEPSKLHSFL